MQPQFNIWQRSYDSKWQLCMWVPREHVVTLDPILFRTKKAEGDYFVREKKTFDTLPELLRFLTKEYGQKDYYAPS